MKPFILATVAVSALVMSACSSLHVRPLSDPGARGVPFYLPKQSIVIEDLGFDAKGKPAQQVNHRIAIVTGPDRNRAYRVANAPHWFADSRFSIQRSTGGVVTQVSGDAEDQIVDTVVELAKIVGSVAGVAMLPPGSQSELDAQQKIEVVLVAELDALSSSAAPRAGATEKIEKALALVQGRIAVLNGAKSQGVAVSNRTTIKPESVDSYADVVAAHPLIPAGEVRVYLVPVE